MLLARVHLSSALLHLRPCQNLIGHNRHPPLVTMATEKTIFDSDFRIPLGRKGCTSYSRIHTCQPCFQGSGGLCDPLSFHKHVQVALLLCSPATCSPIAPASAAAPHLHPHLVWDTCTVELLIRIPPLSYALMGGAISLLILWLASTVQTCF